MVKYHPEEFIGLKIKIEKANNKDLLGIEGNIINETKNTFEISNSNSNKSKKVVMKKDCVFLINNQRINGNKIIRRPEERIKTKK